MATRKLVQDIVPNEKRPSRKIIVEEQDEVVTETPKKIRRKTTPVVDDEELEIVQPLHTKKLKAKNTNSYRNLITFGIIFVSIIVIGLALSLSYSKAIVTITPKIVNFNVEGTFIAKKDATGDDLSYQVITVSNNLTQSVSATKGALIQTKAKGTVTIYNNYSSSSQTLVAGTRISSPDGLIYRTSTTVNVPGKKTTPGSISVAVVADQAGDNYNINPIDSKINFNFPGYKGTDKFNGFYAKLKTAVVGGYSGNKMTINDQSKKDAIAAMENILKDQLLTKLNQNVPQDSILYKTAYNIEYTIPEPSMKGTDTADITVTGTAYGAIFNTKSLIRYIAGKEINKFPSDTYNIVGDKDLVFNISNIKDFSAKKGTSLIFKLNGPIVITGTFSETDLKNQLKGIKLQDSNSVFAKYSSIANAYALITPFWMRSFPNSADKIKIEYKH